MARTGQRTRGAEQALIVLAMVALALAMWTAIPLGWLWVGSQIAGSEGAAPGQASALAYAAVGGGIFVTIVLDAVLLGRLARRHERLTGRRASPHRSAWLRSLQDEPASARGRSGAIVENVMVLSVLLALLVWVAWFLFEAGSPLPP